MTAMVSIRVGSWWFNNGHLYRDGVATNRKGDVCWQQWTCVFCRCHPHSLDIGESSG